MQAILKTFKVPSKVKNNDYVLEQSNNKIAEVKPHRQTKAEKLQYKLECQNLAQEIKDCHFRLEQNETLFNLETDPLLVEQRIFERSALYCRYEYLLKRAKLLKLRIGGLHLSG